MVQILHVHVDPPGTHEAHISAVRWYNPEDGQTSVAARIVMVEFIRGGGVVYTYDGQRRAIVEVVDATAPYIRTRPDASTSNNLLSLPRF